MSGTVTDGAFLIAFYRRQSDGGPGLAQVRELVELYRGRAWAESELGKGSTFRFTLPLAHGGGAAALQH